MHQTLATGARNQWLRGTQGGFGRRFIAAGNRLINAANKSAHFGLLVTIARRASLDFAPFSSMNSNWPCSNLITMLAPQRAHMRRVIGAARPPVNLNVTVTEAVFYLSENFGWRFSIKAAMPSALSSKANSEWNTRRS